MSPEVRRKVDASRAQRLLAEEAARRQALAQSAQSQVRLSHVPVYISLLIISF